MKKSSTIFLQLVIVLIGIGALAFMLWEPHLEGRNAHATLFEVYFKDPFLAYAYIASIPFFTVLYQAFILLRRIRQNQLFSANSMKALRTIKYCALAIIGFVLGGEAYLFIVQRKIEEDIAGGVAMGIFMILISIATASAAALFERFVQKSLGIKSERD